MCDYMKELMYEFMAPNAALTDLEDACRKTLSAGCAGICVPQWFVSAAKQSLGGAAKVATLVGLPGGTTSSFAKYAETKQAIANGADVVLVTVNMALCAAGDFAAAKNDLVASMAPAKKHGCAAAVVDADALNAAQLLETGKLCMEAGVTAVYVTNACEKCIAALLDAGIPAGTFGKHRAANAACCVSVI